MIKPIKELIVVQPDQELEKTKSGIYIPEQAKEKQQKGTVISVGGQVREIKPGDKILFGKYSGSEVEVNGVLYLIFREDDVLGVLK